MSLNCEDSSVITNAPAPRRFALVDSQDEVPSSGEALLPHQADSGSLIIRNRRDYPCDLLFVYHRVSPHPSVFVRRTGVHPPPPPAREGGRGGGSVPTWLHRVFPPSKAVTVRSKGGWWSRCKLGGNGRVRTGRLASFQCNNVDRHVYSLPSIHWYFYSTSAWSFQNKSVLNDFRSATWRNYVF